MSPDYVPSQHLKLVRPAGRARRPSGASQRIARAYHAVRAGSNVLQAAVLAAVLVLANQLVDSWTDGNLLTAWIVLWLLAFAALALLAGPSRQATASIRAAFRAWRERRARAAQDEHYWNSALNDPRLMAEITRDMAASDLPQVRTFNYDAHWPLFLYVPSL